MDELRRAVGGWRRAGLSVGVVPTMGGLHDGHLALVRRSIAECERSIATLFVNPKQFGQAGDLTAYPRDEARDAVLLQEVGADLLFAPGVEEMYPTGFATTVSLATLTDDLEGRHRPGHFDGVSTVVTKLLLQAGADVAYFGEKDYQQYLVVAKMVRDLDIPTRIQAVETVREADGLAMSSRNVHLSEAERRLAPLLAELLREVAAALGEGGESAPLLQDAVARLQAAGFDEVDYFELADARDLTLLARADRPARLLAAARLSNTRLIDNVPVPAACSST